MEIVAFVEIFFIRVQPKHNKGLSFNQQNRLLLEQSYYEIKCVTIETIFFLFVCISVSMSSFKFLERHNKVTKREQYIFGSHLDQHFKYQIVVHSNGSIMKCHTAVNLFDLNLIGHLSFQHFINRPRLRRAIDGVMHRQSSFPVWEE